MKYITKKDFITICEKYNLINWHKYYNTDSFIERPEYGYISSNKYKALFGFRFKNDYCDVTIQDTRYKSVKTNAIILYDNITNLPSQKVICKTKKSFEKICKKVILELKTNKINEMKNKINKDFI